MLWNLVLVAPLLFVVSCQQSQKDPNNGNPMVRDPGQTDVEPNNRQQEEGGDQSSQRSAGSILGDSKKEWTGRCKNAGYRYQLVTLPNDTFNIEQIDGGLTGDSASGDIQMDNGVVIFNGPQTNRKMQCVTEGENLDCNVDLFAWECDQIYFEPKKQQETSEPEDSIDCDQIMRDFVDEWGPIPAFGPISPEEKQEAFDALPSECRPQGTDG